MLNAVPVSGKWDEMLCNIHFIDLQEDHKGHRRNASDGSHAEFKDLMLRDAESQLSKELEKLIKTARPEQMTVSLGQLDVAYKNV